MGRGWAVVGWLALLACGPAVQRQVAGDCTYPFWADDGSSQPMVGCNELVATVFARDGAGGWTELERASVRPGATGFTLGAPAGPYLLSIRYAAAPDAPEFFETSESVVSLGRHLAGRPLSRSAALPTLVTFQVSGLDPWQASDVLEVTSSQAATFRELAAPELPAVLGVGVTSGSLTLDWSTGGGWLPAGAAGDHVYLSQASTRPLPGTAQPYRTATRAAALPSSFTLVDGVGQSVPVQLEAVPQTGHFSADWRLTAFEARRAEVNPAATGTQHELLIDARPHRLVEAPELLGGTPDLAWAQLPTGTADQPLVDVPYGQFLPALWQEYRMLRFSAALRVTAPGATSSLGVLARIARCDPLPAAPGPLAPVLTPARAPRVDGADAFAAPAGVGLTPVLSWSAPELGAPDRYQVVVARLAATASGGTTLLVVGRLSTAASSLRLPPGVLQRGTRYLVWLQASAGRPGWASAPYGVSCPASEAATLFTFST